MDIVGENFDPVATQRVGHGGGVDVDSSFRAFLGAVELMDVQWQAPDRLTGIVPAERLTQFGGAFGFAVPPVTW